MKDLIQSYDDVGTIMLNLGEHLFSEADLNRLEKLSSQLPLEQVEIGDAEERNFLNVGRFITDVERPTLVNRPLSDEALSIVIEKKQMQFFRQLLREDQLFVRRMQLNMLEENCFVGYHLDIDSNPDYLVAVVFQFGSEFVGGDYVVYPDENRSNSYSPSRYSMIVSNCRIPHEVTLVEQGKRISLVYFLSRHEGGNRRHTL